MIAADKPIWLAPVPVRLSTFVNEPAEPSTADLRTVTYRLEKVAYHDSRRCLLPFHDERCRWEGRCWVADGYPWHRITDALNAIAGLTCWLNP